MSRGRKKAEKPEVYTCWCPCGCGAQSDYFQMDPNNTGLCICCADGRSHEVPPERIRPLADLIKQHESILKFYKLVQIQNAAEEENAEG